MRLLAWQTIVTLARFNGAVECALAYHEEPSGMELALPSVSHLPARGSHLQIQSPQIVSWCVANCLLYHGETLDLAFPAA